MEITQNTIYDVNLGVFRYVKMETVDATNQTDAHCAQGPLQPASHGQIWVSCHSILENRGILISLCGAACQCSHLLWTAKEKKLETIQ